MCSQPTKRILVLKYLFTFYLSRKILSLFANISRIEMSMTISPMILRAVLVSIPFMLVTSLGLVNQRNRHPFSIHPESIRSASSNRELDRTEQVPKEEP